MATMILTSNRINRFRHLISYCLKSNKISVFYSYSTLNVSQREDSNKEVIKIPKRIERGPTDILRALADITQRDMSGPDYRYLDDPFLTPLSSNQKRVFSLSRESGRRAAKYVFEEFPELFFRDNSEPKIEAFTYKEIFDESTEVDESDLKKCILRREVNHSIVCYKNLSRDSKDMSSQTLHQLLELVCFHNCEQPLDSEFMVEKSLMKPSEETRLLWKDNGFAEQLFSAIEPKTSQTYCALIQGMAKYSQSQKAYQYYQEMIEKGFKLNTETYNSLLKLAPMLRESSESRWLYIEEVLTAMKSNAIKPNLQTLNNILEVITRFGTMRFSQNLAKKTLVEMTTNLGVEPSLATYYHILNIFYKDRGPNSPVLYEIMDIIEEKEFQIRDPKDVYFFVTAMTICQSRLNDIQLSYRIHKMVSNPKNNKLLANVLNESTYYQRFLRLLSIGEDIKVFMEIYQTYVPHIYIPEPMLVSDILKMIELYEGYHYVPRIWRDFKHFEYITNIKLMEEFFLLISKPAVDQSLRKQFAEIVTEGIKVIDSRLENQLRNGHLMLNQFTGLLLGYGIEVYLNDSNTDNAIKIVNKLRNEKQKIIGSPSPETFIRLCKTALNEKKYNFVKECIEFCIESALFEVRDQLMQDIRESDLETKIKQLFEETCNVSELMAPKVVEPIQSIESANNMNLDEESNR